MSKLNNAWLFYLHISSNCKMALVSQQCEIGMVQFIMHFYKSSYIQEFQNIEWTEYFESGGMNINFLIFFAFIGIV
jgi:hypothetical protein